MSHIKIDWQSELTDGQLDLIYINSAASKDIVLSKDYHMLVFAQDRILSIMNIIRHHRNSIHPEYNAIMGLAKIGNVKYIDFFATHNSKDKTVVAWSSTLLKAPQTAESESSFITRYGVLIELEKTIIFVPDIRLVGEDPTIDFHKLPNKVYCYQQESLDFSPLF